MYIFNMLKIPTKIYMQLDEFTNVLNLKLIHITIVYTLKVFKFSFFLGNDFTTLQLLTSIVKG